MAAPFFTLKGKTLVLIDWANIFHAQRKNGWAVDTRKLLALFKEHPEIHDIVLFHGTDQHEKSQSFLREQAAIGYRIVTKAVKKVPVTVDHEGNPLPEAILRRKCDFDVEIAKEILLNLDRYQGFILMSGDGDYAPILDVLRERRTQTILVFPKGGLGREYTENPLRKHAIFLCSLERLRPFIEFKNIPAGPKSRRA
ncbi:NYN domain-containing protein [Candidatus Peregrinibacteria bacterium]|nr:NYN domain-containing protein [Candidatus Peregrinibacteria bacterium]